MWISQLIAGIWAITLSLPCAKVVHHYEEKKSRKKPNNVIHNPNELIHR
jgi:MFS-type transporter involved in bile tolerance (Atg22 family)